MTCIIARDFTTTPSQTDGMHDLDKFFLQEDRPAIDIGTTEFSIE